MADLTHRQIAPTNGVTCRAVPRYFASRGEPAMDGGPEQCRYCDQEKWRPIVERLARSMRHRAEKGNDKP